MKPPSILNPKPSTRLARWSALLVLAITVIALAASAAVARAASVALAPSSLSVPTVGGIAREGATLTADHGVWAGDGPLTFTYVWEKCDGNGEACVAIAGPSSPDYLIPGSAPERNPPLRKHIVELPPFGRARGLH